MEVNANVYSKRAYDQTSGRIPKVLRPDIGPGPNRRNPWQHCADTFLGHTGATYMFSGTAMAVYHPEIKSGISGAETDPETSIDTAGYKIIAYGSAIPKALMVAFEAKKSTIPQIELAFQRQQTETRIRKIHATGRGLHEVIQNQVQAVGKVAIGRLTTAKTSRFAPRTSDQEGKYCYSLPARSPNFHDLLEVRIASQGPLSPVLRPALEYYWLPIPIGFWVSGERPPESAAEEFARCAVSVFLARDYQDLEGVGARIMDRLVWGAAKERLVERGLKGFLRELVMEAEALEAMEMSESTAKA